jgi:hypothetical protein
MTLSFPEFFLKSQDASVHFEAAAEFAPGLAILACHVNRCLAEKFK